MSLFSPLIRRRRALSPTALALIAGGLASTVDKESVKLEACEERKFVRLFATPDYDAWLIAWSPSAALEAHDHGGSSGAVHVVDGFLFETYVDRGTGGETITKVRATGDTFGVPEHRIHEVWNGGRDVALTVHVYSPPLEQMDFFDLNGGAPTPK